MTKSPNLPLLNVETCHHGKENDGGLIAVQQGCSFSFPACGRKHVATPDKYPIDERYLAEEKKQEELRARAAHARQARKGRE